jgi:hypothetical protein
LIELRFVRELEELGSLFHLLGLAERTISFSLPKGLQLLWVFELIRLEGIALPHELVLHAVLLSEMAFPQTFVGASLHFVKQCASGMS